MKKLYILLLFMVCAGYAQQQPFVTTWEVQDDDLVVTIPVFDNNNNYTADFGDGTILTNQSGQITHEYNVPGVYTISLSGNVSRLYSEENSQNMYKLKTIEQWGDIVWSSMESAFNGCYQIIINATDSPNLSQATNMSSMFRFCNLSNSNININNWDTSHITNMSHLFEYSHFNELLDNWNVSNVTDMSYMFSNAEIFNQTLNNWDVSNVTNMNYMFNRALVFEQSLSNWDVSNIITTEGMFYQATAFNQSINNWNVSNVINMKEMFRNSAFNQSLNGWDVSNVTNMQGMFTEAWNFNGALDQWNVSNVVNMEAMFKSTPFNQPLNNWDVINVVNMKQLFSMGSYSHPLDNWNVSNVADMSGMFEWCNFNQPIYNWDVSNVTNMAGMFAVSSFNQPIGNWDVSNVTNMAGMFSLSHNFNQPIENWDVSSVATMEAMFGMAEEFNHPIENWDVTSVITMRQMFVDNEVFDQLLEGWDVSNVQDMTLMFKGSTYNKPLNNWNVSGVTKMVSMFAYQDSFNQSLDNWDVSNVSDMRNMFRSASVFNQDISNWNFNNDVTFANSINDVFKFLNGSGLDMNNYNALLVRFAQLELQNKILHAQGLKYCNTGVHDYLTNILGWVISGDSLSEECQGNTVTGTMLIDENQNGCEASDTPAVNFMVQATNGTYNYGTFVNADGAYDLRVQEDTYTIAPVNVPSYFTVTPPSAEVTFTGFGNSEALNFCLVPNQSIQDLNITVLPIGDARPGFESEYKILVENIGTQSVSNATVTLTFDNTLQSFVLATPVPATTAANQLTFTVGSVSVFETKEINLTMTTFVPPIVNGGEVAVFTATVSPDAGDNTPSDNTFTLNQTIVNSFDPNDKRVVQGEEIFIEQADEYLDYIIRFQNTGTASAITVRVDDVLSENLDWTTLKPIASSHAYRVEVTEGNKVSFIFDTINLPHEAANAEGSNGYIAYKIKPISTIQVGDVMGSEANIYFDFNLPIVTNIATTTVVPPLGVKEYIANNVTIYPNPASTVLHIQPKANTQLQEVKIYNLQGRELMNISQHMESIDVSSLSTGVYMLMVKTNAGLANYKLVKK